MPPIAGCHCQASFQPLRRTSTAPVARAASRLPFIGIGSTTAPCGVSTLPSTSALSMHGPLPPGVPFKGQHAAGSSHYTQAHSTAANASHAHQDHQPSAPPLVVTAELDQHTQAIFEELRRKHFPPERVQVGAHLTLFHALPGAFEPQVLNHLRETAAAQRPIKGMVDRLLNLGRGVAYHIEAPALIGLRRSIAKPWETHLTRQDAAPWRNPHITVQNKVALEMASALLEELKGDFEAFPVRIEALRLWRYMGGPWEEVERLPFGGGGNGSN